jgi:L-asparaginase
MQALQRSTLVVLATGGTIAGLRAACDVRGYVAAQVGVQGLVSGVPVPAGFQVRAEQVAQVDSKDMTHAIWRDLALRAIDELARDDVAGVVVTHGTDTMEETAVFLERVVAPADKPLVLTGAMRPADAPDADGPRNLAQALALAAMPAARGVVVAISGEVHAARAVRKAHPSRMDAFASAGSAPLARWIDGELEMLVPPASWPVEQGTRRSILEADPPQWPRIEIVTSHAGSDGRIVDALLAQGDLRGLIVATTGNGTLHRELEAALDRAVRAGVVVRRVTRCVEGTIDDRETRWGASAMPSAAKARVELMLDLPSPLHP